jgi:hypothetical protein
MEGTRAVQISVLHQLAHRYKSEVAIAIEALVSCDSIAPRLD